MNTRIFARSTDEKRPAIRSVSGRSVQAGFTLIELLVVCGIIVVVSAVVLANQNKFGGQVLLDSFAYDVALSIRTAQVYGTGAHVTVCPSGSGFPGIYGIHFTKSDNTGYEIFADCNGDGVYESGIDTIANGGTYTITHGYKISELCAPSAGCTQSLNTLDIAFQRPEPVAKISANGVSCINDISNCETDAQITLVSPRGDTKAVTVSNNGQIDVQQN